MSANGQGTAPTLVPPVHFIGIGGSGMSGIARILLARGVPVTGSDMKDSRTLASLAALGADVTVGHSAANVDGAGTVVISTAIRDGNPELEAARSSGIPVIRRADALAAVMQGKRGIAVAGTHGKTTTTSMVVVALQACGQDPSFAIGGDLHEAGANAHDGSGPDFVAEADESDSSFLALSPAVVIVTNIEADHLDHFPDEQAIDDAFDALVDRLPRDGVLVVCADDPGSARLLARARSRGVDIRSYGTTPDADLVIGPIELRGRGSRSGLVLRGVRLGDVVLQVPGEHNVRNAAAALLAALAVGQPSSGVLEGLARFTGARRRFEPKGTAAGVEVFDDYAHHPTEVAVTIDAARAVSNGRVIAVFQPHHYYRTAAFLKEFGEALGRADEVVVMEVYAPGEEPILEATGAALAEAVPLGPDKVAFVGSLADVPAAVAQRVLPGDLVLTMGAPGDVSTVGPAVLEILDSVRA